MISTDLHFKQCWGLAEGQQMHLLSCKGRDSKLYRADGRLLYCTSPHVPVGTPAALQTGTYHLHQPSLSQGTHSTMNVPQPCHWAGRTLSQSKQAETELWQPFCCCRYERGMGPGWLSHPSLSTSLTLSIWTAWPNDAACHFATEPSFS